MTINEKSKKIMDWCKSKDPGCENCILKHRKTCYTFYDECSKKNVEENYDLVFGSIEEVDYDKGIIDLLEKQREKGLSKYGETLEENTTLSREQRVDHLEEELVDALRYCEHLKMTFRDSLTANDYQRMAMRTAGDKSENYLDNAIMGLCGEVGECADIVKKHHFQGHELDHEKLKDELSDVCWYVALLATALDLTLEEVMIHNVDKLKKRYPDGFDKARSINREN